MNSFMAIAIDLWTFGAPIALIVYSLLRLLRRTPARVRYLAAIAGFAASIAIPLSATWFAQNPLPAAGLELVSPVAMGRAGSELLQQTEASHGSTLLAMWIAGSLLLILREALGHLRLRTMMRNAQPASDELRRALAWDDRISLLAGNCRAPYTGGILRPAVVLPADVADRFELREIERMARHELSHARWRDPMVYALLRLIAALLWLSPVWLMLRWVRREREVAADEYAIGRGAPDHREYVELLIRISRGANGGDGEGRLVAAVAASDLEYRARCILASSRWRTLPLAIFALAAGVVLAATAAPARRGDRSARAVAPGKAAAAASSAQPPIIDPGDVPTRQKAKRAIAGRSDPLVFTRSLVSVAREAHAVVDLPQVRYDTPARHVAAHVDADRHVDIDRHDDGKPAQMDVPPVFEDQRIRVVIRNEVRHE